MAYKNREVQPELFCTLKKKQKQNILHKNIFQDHYKSSFTVSCDTLIVIIIALLMVNLSTFAIGIEKGKSLTNADSKKIVNKKQKQLLAIEKPEVPQQVIATIKEPQYAAKIIAPKAAESQEINTDKKGYIIQIVTYSSNSNADKEAQKLKDQGYRSNVRKSGEYFIVYSGTYESKTSAIEKLPGLKKRYKDCFVRFLKNT
ncbi:MAG: SPOR domain-containing protein [Candidatus Omnitrophica bacterium]|nr:SPOR domain-containing protein [Candidatus Omnitrophota bacterium]